jgi:NADH dehydrogenase [ubiquinone] 1 alpha subcomplex assembly factor 7
MSDALRATRRVPGFHDAVSLHLVEQSPVLRQMQREKLAVYQPQFHDHIAKLPPGPVLLIANEFIDALPIQQFERRDGAWHQRQIVFDEEAGGLTLRTDPLPSPTESLLPQVPNGAVLETRLSNYDAYIAARLRDRGGAALIIDYGYFPSQSSDTLQAVRQHQKVPVIEAPGEVDLTALVDVHLLAVAASGNGAAVYGPVTQAQFLIALGIAAREAALMKNAASDQQTAIRSGCRRLIEPAEMGSLFKVLALTQQGGPVPAGFGAATP